MPRYAMPMINLIHTYLGNYPMCCKLCTDWHFSDIKYYRGGHNTTQSPVSGSREYPIVHVVVHLVCLRHTNTTPT